MPFGLTNAPAVFQAMIIDVLRDFFDKFVYVYLDDILIYSPDFATHKNHVNQVLQRLLDNHLYVKAEKSEFHVSTVSFLGFIVAPGRVEMDPAKISAVAEWPTPNSRKKVQQFLGFVNFYRVLSGGSALLQHLCMPSLLLGFVSSGLRRRKTLSTSSNAASLPHPFPLFQIPSDSSWWRWMRLTTALGRCCLNGRRKAKCIPAPSCPGGSVRRSATMTSATGNCWL